MVPTVLLFSFLYKLDPLIYVFLCSSSCPHPHIAQQSAKWARTGRLLYCVLRAKRAKQTAPKAQRRGGVRKLSVRWINESSAVNLVRVFVFICVQALDSART